MGSVQIPIPYCVINYIVDGSMIDQIYSQTWGEEGKYLYFNP